MASSSHTVTINGIFLATPPQTVPANYNIVNWQITFTSLDASPFTITSIESVTGVGNIYNYMLPNTSTYNPNATVSNYILDLLLFTGAGNTDSIQYMDINNGEASVAQVQTTQIAEPDDIVGNYQLNYDNETTRTMDPFQYTNNNNNNIPSNICFPAKTPITVDQGIVNIEKLDLSIHTINNKRIVAVTKTTSLKDYLVRFEKDALGDNLPSKTTTISPEHKIVYNNQLIKAKYFVNQFENVTKLEYNGETLYNVLLDDYSKMTVNNLIVETLHPESDIAQLYNGNARGKKPSYIMKNMMNSIIRQSESHKNTSSILMR